MLNTNDMGAFDALTKIQKYILYVVVIFFVLFVLSGFPSPYAIPKEVFALSGICLILIFWTAKAIYDGRFSFAFGKFDIPILLVVIAYAVSSIVETPNKMEAFLYPGTATFILIAALLYFLVNQFDKKDKKDLLSAFVISGILLSLSVFMSLLGLYAKIPQLPAFFKDSTFNPAGGYLPASIYLVAIIPIAVVSAMKDKDWTKKIFFGVAGVILLLGTGILIYNLLPGKPAALILPNFQTSWTVATQALTTSPVWGIGPGNYLSAFDLGRPISYNATNLWNSRFLTATNYYFTLITEVGLAGLAAFIILILKVYRTLSKDFSEKHWEELSIVIILAAFAVLPSDPSLIFLLMILLAVFSGSEEKISSLSAGRVPSAITALPIWVAVIALAFFGTKAVSAEYTFQKAIDAINQNNGTQAYSMLVSAIKQNPYVDRYHSVLAQIDLQLANSLASKKNPTDTDKQTVTSLIQESISEAKNTVALNSGRSENWQVLAQIYATIIPYAQGSDQYAIDSYNQAIALDPINPNLRIALGGVYYGLGRYDDAINSFGSAVLAKPDFANAHYNLAMAYKEKKDYNDAITQMNLVLQLIKPGNADYDLAKSTLDDLEKNKPATSSATTKSPTAQTPEQPALTTPQVNATPSGAPQISLPNEATPPATTKP